ncbi:4Fe-4S dicluster domain-containing protein [Clostridium magnum]|uniref:Hydrogenase-4 component A n=1 Tax=Clostridium magnum DSM 2767 TaxID=1121326 RepID=A0A162S3C9_9CLOT|nr:4Fe-4S dicluster domain-containing protein [Clostridium magnum]KZL90721.1 hydrogenase-4 component A [Clostridium magnum DSM 2767]SHI41826.1 electron transport protein HydN [Clostridium magnum DSM 2767]
MNTFVVANPNKCIGCKACEIACAVAHLDTSVATAGYMETPFSPRISLVREEKVTMPIQCRQCDDAPCANVCPVSAIVHKDDKIVVKTELCIGCKTCMVACPLGAMDMVPQYPISEEQIQANLSVVTEEGEENKEVMVAHKCDLCAGRPGGPACVEVCPGEAFVVVKQKVISDSIKNKRLSSALDIMRK